MKRSLFIAAAALTVSGAAAVPASAVTTINFPEWPPVASTPACTEVTTNPSATVAGGRRPPATENMLDGIVVDACFGGP